MKLKLTENGAIFLAFLLLYVNVLRPFPIYSILSASVDILVILFLIVHLFMQGINKRILFLVSIVFAFFFISILQMFNPNVPSIFAGLEGFRKTSLALILAMLGFLSFKDLKKYNTFVKKFVLISIPFLLYGLKQYFFLTDIDYLYLNSNSANIYTGQLFGRERAISFFAGPFHFGMFSSMVALLSLYMYKLNTKFKLRIFWLGVFFLSFLACYSSLTRTNLLALIFAVLLFFVLINIKKFLISFPILVISLVVLFNTLISNTYKLLASDKEFFRLLGTILNLTNDTRFLGRTGGWEEILYLMKKRPFSAYGMGSAGDTLQNIYNFNYHVTSHNFYLKILMETGVIGLALMIFFITITVFILFSYVMKAKNKNEKILFATSLSIFSIFIVNTFVNSTIETYPVSGFMLMFAVSSLSFKPTNYTSKDQENRMPESPRNISATSCYIRHSRKL